MANNENLQPFQKGDARINRKGRPKSFDAWRKLLQSIMDEPATDASGKLIVVNGHIATNAEMFARDWMKDRKGRRDFAANVYGKPPEKHELTGKDGEPLIPPPPAMPDEERIARMKELAVLIADEVNKLNA
jgi:hypothetical protein